MSATTTLPRAEPAGGHDETHFLRMEGDGQIRLHGDVRDLARRGVDAGGDVDRDDRRSCGVHPVDELRGLRTRRAVEARTEERVDDDVVAVEILVGLVGDVSRLAQSSRRDPPVASVRAAAADTREPSSPPGTRASPRARRRRPHAP